MRLECAVSDQSWHSPGQSGGVPWSRQAIRRWPGLWLSVQGCPGFRMRDDRHHVEDLSDWLALPPSPGFLACENGNGPGCAGCLHYPAQTPGASFSGGSWAELSPPSLGRLPWAFAGTSVRRRPASVADSHRALGSVSADPLCAECPVVSTLGCVAASLEMSCVPVPDWKKFTKPIAMC